MQGLLLGMALIPAGTFYMGSDSGYPNERPRREVYLSAFQMDVREVSAKEFQPFAEKTGLNLRKQPCPDCPVVYVSWDDAQAYCKSRAKRLPTEAEWEKAALGGSAGPYAFGEDEKRLGEHAWYWDNSKERLHPVGLKKHNAYGLHDMHGNALEWTADWYDPDYYRTAPARDPKGPAKGEERSVRGGSAFLTAKHLRASQRMKGAQTNRYSGRGFRCAAQAP